YHGPKPDNLVDATVRLTGASGTRYNGKGAYIGVETEIPGMAYFKLIAPAPTDPYASPTLSINRLVRFTPEGTFNHRIKISGVVTLQRLGKWLYVRDGTD